MAYTDMTSAFFYKKLLTWQDMDRLAENDAYLLGNKTAPGSVVEWFTATPPEGWVILNGQEVSRTGDGLALFTLWGTKYGVGDGSSTFNVADMRGRSPLGAGTGSGLTARTLDAEVGAEISEPTFDNEETGDTGDAEVSFTRPLAVLGWAALGTGDNIFIRGKRINAKSVGPSKVCHFIVKL